MALLERGWLENHVNVDDQVVGPFVIRERSNFGYKVIRLVRKSEGLDARDYVHCIPSMLLH